MSVKLEAQPSIPVKAAGVRNTPSSNQAPAASNSTRAATAPPSSRVALKGVSLLEQLANAASWQAEADRMHQQHSSTSKAVTRAAGHTHNLTPSQKDIKTSHLSKAVHMQRGPTSVSTAFTAPSAPVTGAPALNPPKTLDSTKAPQAFPQPLPSLSSRVSNQNIILRVAKPHQQQQQQEASDSAGSTRPISTAPVSRKGHKRSISLMTSTAPKVEDRDQREPATRSLEYMRGFHSTPDSVRR